MIGICSNIVGVLLSGEDYEFVNPSPILQAYTDVHSRPISASFIKKSIAWSGLYPTNKVLPLWVSEEIINCTKI